MDELQDAIEDAQYVNAMHDDTPKPTKEWKWPNAEEYRLFFDSLRTSDPGALALESICTSCLGLYLFVDFVKRRGERNFALFLLEAANYRKLAPQARKERAELVYKSFLSSNQVEMRNLAQDPNLSREILPSQDIKWDDFISKTSKTEIVAKDEKSSRKMNSERSGEKSTSRSKISGAPVEKVRNALRLANSKGNSTSYESPTENKLSSEIMSPTSNYEPSTSSVGDGPIGAVESPHFQSTDDTDSAKKAEEDGSLLEPNIKIAVQTDDLLEESDIQNDRGLELLNLDTATHFLPSTLFDEIDYIIFSYLRESYFTEFQQSVQWSKYFRFLLLSTKKVNEDDFSLFRVLGRGGFGLVNGCKKATTGKLYAMKMMNKKRVKMKKSESLCLNERLTLASVDSPFIVCLRYAFSTPQELYLILDLMMGGDLGFHLSRKGRFSSNEAKYYAARTILGIGALHQLGIVYRDLKPENILMGLDGETKISDLGLATKMKPNGLSDVCGTRGYWAPEMIRRDANGKRGRYNEAVDWFSMGCCIYEFLYGVSPFRTDRARNFGGFDPKKERDKAIDKATVEMDPEFDSSCFDSLSIDLCSKMLEKDAQKRLGANGVEEIIRHPWFGSLDWESIKSGKTKPPFKPAKDINMFSQSEIGAFSDETASNKIILSDEDQEFYKEWDFISIPAFHAEVVEFLRYEEIHGPIVPQSTGTSCCVLS